MKYFICKIILLLFLLNSVSNSQNKEHTVTLDLKDFVISFQSIVTDSHYDYSFNDKGDDTTLVYLELGDSPENNLLTFDSGEVEIVNVYQRYETSATIMNEGPHLDLIDWLHYTSGWVALEKSEDYSFKSIPYSEEEASKFPEVDIEKLKSMVKNIGGENWAELVKDVNSINEYPVGIGISKIEFRIEYILKKVKKVKYIVFEMPLGC
jgi:hypothetical protein